MDTLKKAIQVLFIHTEYVKDSFKMSKVNQVMQITGDKNMKLYEDVFEKAMLEETSSFYQAKSQEWASLSTEEFAESFEKSHKSEEELCEKLFEETSKPKVLGIVSSYKYIVTVNNQPEEEKKSSDEDPLMIRGAPEKEARA